MNSLLTPCPALPCCLPTRSICCIKLHIYCSMQKKAYQRAMLLPLLLVYARWPYQPNLVQTPLGSSSSSSSRNSPRAETLLLLVVVVIYICKPCCNVCAFAVCWASQHWQLHIAYTHPHKHTDRQQGAEQSSELEPIRTETEQNTGRNDEKLKIMFMLLFAFAIFAISLLYALFCVISLAPPAPSLFFPFLSQSLPYHIHMYVLIFWYIFSLCYYSSCCLLLYRD